LVELAVALGLVLGLKVSLEVGFRMGRRAAKRGHAAADRSQVGTIQASALGLLALLVGFSFAGSYSRFVAREELVVSEANAIGTALLRADLLDTQTRPQMHALFAQYVDTRVDLLRAVRPERCDEASRAGQALHPRLWETAVGATRGSPQLAMLVLPPINDVIDLHSTLGAALRRHVPLLVTGSLLLCAVLSMIATGYGSGLSGKRINMLNLALALLIATSLWITLDLDAPRMGLIRMSIEPMLDLQRSLR
jgi:hypothetical protein